MGLIRNVAEKIGLKTYSMPVDSFIEQLKEVDGKGISVEQIECYDVNNEIVYLENSGEVEAKFTLQNGKSKALFFDTLYIENGELHGSNKLTIGNFGKKTLLLSDIARIELQANKKSLRGTKGKSAWGAMIGIVIMLVVVEVASNYTKSKSSPSIDKVMTEAADEMNKSCPMVVDKETRLDNVVALPDSIFQYNYTLVNIDKSDPRIETAKSYLDNHILIDVKNNPGLKVFRDNKMTMAYSYKDKNGEFLFKISITPADYAQ